MILPNIHIFDTEVFRHNWVFVSKSVDSNKYVVIHNDRERLAEFLETTEPLLAGFNNKNYDQFILKAILIGAEPEEIKELSDYIVKQGGKGWEHPLVRDVRAHIEQFDLFDDTQQGLSLKAIEAHLGLDIQETEIDFDIERALTEEEVQQVIDYCKADVDATEKLLYLREDYLKTKLFLGRKKGIPDAYALYMTNAKLTAAYLGAKAQQHNDERHYEYPKNLLEKYIPQNVFDFFESNLGNPEISDDEAFKSKLNFKIGDCLCTIGWGGIHGAIPTYREKASDKRYIRNQDVRGYYPHLMTIEGYCSRNMSDPAAFADVVAERDKAKLSGDKETASALKLVCNTTYGGTLNVHNELYDPLMARSVCITGQLRLLELAMHLVADCPSLKVIQLNTDGLMASLDESDLEAYYRICTEWQQRTGYELEEDLIDEIIQKDVNNYIMRTGGKVKCKGGVLVRGISTQGAFKINTNAIIVANAVTDYFTKGTPVEETINACELPEMFWLIAKATGKFSAVYHFVNGKKIRVQRCNRVYAARNSGYGTLYRTHKETNSDMKVPGMPEHCIIDNSNNIKIEEIDKEWYIRLAKRYINDFVGVKPPKKNTRKINLLAKEALALLEADGIQTSLF